MTLGYRTAARPRTRLLGDLRGRGYGGAPWVGGGCAFCEVPLLTQTFDRGIVFASRAAEKRRISQTQSGADGIVWVPRTTYDIPDFASLAQTQTVDIAA